MLFILTSCCIKPRIHGEAWGLRGWKIRIHHVKMNRDRELCKASYRSADADRAAHRRSGHSVDLIEIQGRETSRNESILRREG